MGYKAMAALFQVILILCTLHYSLAEDVSVCVKSDEAAVCQQENVTYTIDRLSDLSAFLDTYSNAQILRVHLTSGNHLLTKSLEFTTKKVEIQGDMTKGSFIQCTNMSGMEFKNNKNLQVKDLTIYAIAKPFILKTLPIP